MREKLIKLLQCSPTDIMGNHGIGALADHLIANGVTIPVRCKECRYYTEYDEYCGFWGECRHPEHFCEEGVSMNG